jgi:hypothetical protein
VVLPGVASGAGERRLQILAPGDSDVIVRLRLLAESGPFVPAGMDVIQVAAGTVADVDLARFAGGENTAVELTADGPVTAGLLARVGTGAQLEELAYTAAAQPLTAARPGVVALATLGGATSGQLVLAAPGTASATVQLAALPPGTAPPIEVTVAGGTQRAVDLAALTTGTAAVSIVPAAGSAPVFVARILSEAAPRGPLLTVTPILPARYTVLVPSVEGDLSTGLRAQP